MPLLLCTKCPARYYCAHASKSWLSLKLSRPMLHPEQSSPRNFPVSGSASNLYRPRPFEALWERGGGPPQMTQPLATSALYWSRVRLYFFSVLVNTCRSETTVHFCIALYTLNLLSTNWYKLLLMNPPLFGVFVLFYRHPRIHLAQNLLQSLISFSAVLFCRFTAKFSHQRRYRQVPCVMLVYVTPRHNPFLNLFRWWVIELHRDSFSLCSTDSTGNRAHLSMPSLVKSRSTPSSLVGFTPHA